MLPLPPLNPLKTFEVAARVSSITRAAEELCVTPAAVSRQIRSLEEFLGVQLFDRSGGRFVLTEPGRRYLESISPLLAGLREATNAVMGGSFRRHVLRLRSPATLAVKWLIPRLAGFHSAHPNIDVQVATSSAPIDFDREALDGGVELGDGARPRVHSRRLMDNLLVPVMAPASQLFKPSTVADLKHCTLLHSLARPDDWRLWLAAAGAVDASAAMSVNAYAGMKYETSLLAYQAAAEGHGVALAQRVLVEKQLQTGELITPLDFVLDQGTHTYHFVWPADREPSRALSAFLNWLLTLR
jgi:LysR family glycine cleavage system transcriptional activator